MHNPINKQHIPAPKATRSFGQSILGMLIVFDTEPLCKRGRGIYIVLFVDLDSLC